MRHITTRSAVAIVFAAASASAALVGGPSSAAPPTTTAVAPPAGYMTLVDSAGLLTMTVPQTWNDVSIDDFTDDGGVSRAAIEAAPNLFGFEASLDVPGAWIETQSYRDPQSEIDQFGITGCTSLVIEPYAGASLTGLVQRGTGCGAAGEGTFNLIVASPPDQSVTIRLLVQIVTPADQPALDLVLQTFGFAAPGAVSVGTVPTPIELMGTVPVSALTPGRGLDGPIDVLPPAVPGEVTIIGVNQTDGGDVIVVFRNGTDQAITGSKVRGRIYGPDGSVIHEVGGNWYDTATPETIDPGGAGFFEISRTDLTVELLPAGWTHDLTVTPNPQGNPNQVQFEVTELANDGDVATATVTNPFDSTIDLFVADPWALCLDAAGTVLDSTVGAAVAADGDRTSLDPGASMQFTLDFYVLDACAHVLVSAETFV